MMTSNSEVFCRDRRLYDVRRGVVYLRRTDELAQRQWRHFGAVPPIRMHVIRDVGLSATRADVTADVTGAQRSEAATPPWEGCSCSGQDFDHSAVREEKERGLATDVTSDFKRNDEDRKEVVRGSTENNFRYQTRVLEQSAANHPLISITEVTEISHTATPTMENPAEGASLTELARLHIDHHQHPLQQQREPSVGSTAANEGEARNRTSLAPTLTMQTHRPTPLDSDDRPGVTTGTSRQVATSGYGQQTVTNTTLNDLDVLRASKEPRDGHEVSSLGDGGRGGPFNTWGSRTWDVEDKLQEELKPKNYSPKRYPPQSRVASDETLAAKNKRRRRQRRIMTDFRSRNGTVRIIKPLPPVIDTKKSFSRAKMSHDLDDGFDIEDLARERTYVMLQRIDRLLEPAKACFPSDLSSTEREVCSSATPTTAASLRRLRSISKDEALKLKMNETVETEEDNVNPEILSLLHKNEANGEKQPLNGTQNVPLNRTTVNLKHFYEKPVRVLASLGHGEVASDTSHCSTVWNPDETIGYSCRQPIYDSRIPQIFLEERAGHRAWKSHQRNASLLLKLDQPNLGPDFDVTGHGALFQQQAGADGSRLQVPPSSVDPLPERSNVFFYPPRAAVTSWAAEPSRAQPQQHAQHGRGMVGLSCLVHPPGSLYLREFGHHHPHLSRGETGGGSRQALVEARGLGWRDRGEGRGLSVEDVVAKLERRRVDLHGKCEEWVKRCSGYFNTADNLLL